MGSPLDKLAHVSLCVVVMHKVQYAHPLRLMSIPPFFPIPGTYTVSKVGTYMGMCRKGAGPISSKPALLIHVPTATNAGPQCG